jgi:hypothetical protein
VPARRARRRAAPRRHQRRRLSTPHAYPLICRQSRPGAEISPGLARCLRNNSCSELPGALVVRLSKFGTF